MVRCVDCKFFHAVRRECRIFPPVFNGFPEVLENTWCGCGQPRQLEGHPPERVEENVTAVPAPDNSLPLAAAPESGLTPRALPKEPPLPQMTREEIMVELDYLGVKYLRRDSRADLIQKLKEATENAV